MNADRKKILILAANPKGTSRLRLDEEVRAIHQGLRMAEQRDQFELHQRWAITNRDLSQALLDVKPQILHFCGHGTGVDGLTIEDEGGQAHLLPTQVLGDLLALFQHCLECVVLNACYSEVQAEAISQNIGYVIGMSQAIGDRAAISFAIGFYDALGGGRSYSDAYRFGCIAIAGEQIPEELTPQIKVKPQISIVKPPPVHSPSSSPTPKNTSPKPNLQKLYSQASQEHQADNWQNAIDIFDRIHAVDPHYPDPKQWFRSAKQELDLEKRYDRACHSENRGELKIALQQFEYIHQWRSEYRDVETHITRLRHATKSRASQVHLMKFVVAWIACWLIIGLCAKQFLNDRGPTTNVAAIMAICGLMGGLVTYAIKQLLTQPQPLKPQQIALWSGIDVSLWTLMSQRSLLEILGLNVPSAAIAAATLSFLKNCILQVLQSPQGK
jgi:hypothetical protein